MKSRVLIALASLVCVAAPTFGATNISYTATADPNTNPDGTDSNGNAVDVWTLTHTGDGTSPTNYGSFLGNSAGNGGGSGAGAGTSAWGLYASGSTAGNNEVDIGHTFDGGMLSLGQTVSIQFDAGYVDSGGNSYGIRLFGPSGFVLALSFSGGDNTYRYYDAGPGGTSAGVGYDPDGFTFSYTQTGATTYTATETSSGGTMLGSFSGTVSGAPDFIQVYNNNAGAGSNYDVFANNLSVVPEPGTYAWIGVGAGMMGLACLRRRRVSSAH